MTTPVITPITLFVDQANAAWTPGKADFPIGIVNPDGTTPTLDTLTSVASATVSPNPGTNPNWPVATYPYVGNFTAAGVGTGNSNLTSDGIVNQTFAITVTAEPPQVASVDPTLIVVTPPGPPA